MSRSCGKRKVRGSWKTGSIVMEGSGRRCHRDEIMQVHPDLMRKTEGRAKETKRRETLLIHSLSKYLMSVYYTPGTLLGGMVRVELGKILVPVEPNSLPREVKN